MNKPRTTRIPTDFSAEYRSRSDEDLLQLWMERSELLPEAEVALQNEIGRRGLAREAGAAEDRKIEDDSIDVEEGEKPTHRLATALLSRTVIGNALVILGFIIFIPSTAVTILLLISSLWGGAWTLMHVGVLLVITVPTLLVGLGVLLTGVFMRKM